MSVNVIVASRKWYHSLANNLSQTTGQHFILIETKEELTVERLSSLNPRYVFIAHWSHIIPPEIYKVFECVIFHMTDLPFGRGGSPLQNLIARGIDETMISALRCEAEVDAGPIYMKRPLSLFGTAEEIYLRTASEVEKMIVEIVRDEPTPVKQHGKVTTFERRKPQESDISELTNLTNVFDYIRMLDAEGYPRAFLETDHLRLEFQRPSLKHGKIISDVIITMKEKYEKGSGRCGSS